MKIWMVSLLLILSVSCIKTAEQVQREKRIESMDEQLHDSQGLVAELVSQNKDMQKEIDRLNGRFEEMEHKNKNTDADSVKKLNESIDLVKAQQEAQNTQLLQIQNELKEQRAFIEKVTSSLSDTKSAPKSTNHTQKKSAKKDLDHGLDLIKLNSFSDARSELEALIDHPELSAGEKNKVLHGLGKVEYYTKNFDKSLVYFSKIFSKFPKATLAPSSLLFIGRNLEKMGKKDEAKEAFAKVVEEYPSSPEAKEAKKEM